MLLCRAWNQSPASFVLVPVRGDRLEQVTSGPPSGGQSPRPVWARPPKTGTYCKSEFEELPEQGPWDGGGQCQGRPPQGGLSGASRGCGHKCSPVDAQIPFIVAAYLATCRACVAEYVVTVGLCVVLAMRPVSQGEPCCLSSWGLQGKPPKQIL